MMDYLGQRRDIPEPVGPDMTVISAWNEGLKATRPELGSPFDSFSSLVVREGL
ncbi:MAG TPA: hypothetical protein VMS00_04865 [Acidimicrobiales bacterium]|nr:hypothetical protein [Acidimicrobiales bacterium]